MENILNYQRVEKAIQYLSENFRQQPNLDKVAEIVNLSPFHFQKIFTEWAGVSPKKFLQFLTADFLKSQITKTNSIIEAAEIAGFSSQSRVYDLFVTLEAVTPDQFKTNGNGLYIEYGCHQSPFGECFIAVTEKGLCALEFISGPTKHEVLDNFLNAWRFAQIELNQESTFGWVQKIFERKKNILENKLNVLVQGTNFQLKVWQALLSIPFGSITTYEQIASKTGSPKATRAVGSAVGRNAVAFLIPCHRVIRKEGKLGEYKWGDGKKKAIIGWEAAKIYGE